MPPLWLLLDLHDMAAVTAGLFFTGSLVVTVFAAEFVNHHSTVGTSAPEEAASSGAGIRVVELPSEEHQMAPRPVPAGAETEKDHSCGGSFALSAVPSGDPTPR
jgi:hypothetical protein